MQTAKDVTKIAACWVLALGFAAVAIFVCLRLHQLGADEAAERAASVELQNRASDDLHSVALKAVGTLAGVDRQVSAAGPVFTSANKVLATYNTSGVKLNAALDEVNRDCDESRTKRPCGTLADLAKLLKEARGATGQVKIAATHADTSLTTFDGKEAKLIDSANGDLVQLAQTLKDADGVVTDPATKEMQQNLADLSKSAAGIGRDGRKLADKFTGPQPWWKKALGASEASLKFAACATGHVTCSL